MLNTPKIVLPLITKLPNKTGNLVPDISCLLKDQFLIPYSVLTTRPRPLAGKNNMLLVKETEDIFCSAWPKNKLLLRESTHSLLVSQTPHKALVYYRRCQYCLIHPCESCPLDLASIIGFQTHFKKEEWNANTISNFKSLPITERRPKRILLNEICDANGKPEAQILILLKHPIPVKKTELDFNTSNMHLQDQDESSPKILKMLKEISENNHE